jgi:hypothetical protein
MRRGTIADPEGDTDGLVVVDVYLRGEGKLLLAQVLLHLSEKWNNVLLHCALAVIDVIGSFFLAVRCDGLLPVFFNDGSTHFCPEFFRELFGVHAFLTSSDGQANGRG